MLGRLAEPQVMAITTATESLLSQPTVGSSTNDLVTQSTWCWQTESFSLSL